MKQALHYLLGFSIIVSLLTLQSCVDSKYDLDDINKNGVIPIPPVPVGDLDTIWISTLSEFPELPPNELNEDEASIIYSYTISNLFGEDATEKIFYEGAKDVTLVGLADVLVSGENNNLRVGIKFEVLDEEYNVIDKIKIPDQNHLTYGKAQPITVLFASQYMIHFEGAEHLRLQLQIKANSISISPKDYILFNKMIFKTGGIHVEL